MDIDMTIEQAAGNVTTVVHAALAGGIFRTLEEVSLVHHSIDMLKAAAAENVALKAKIEELEKPTTDGNAR